MSLSLRILAEDYFRFLAECFPVMCSSDEFDFLPRAQGPCETFSGLEDMDRDRIAGLCREIRKYRLQFEQAKALESDLVPVRKPMVPLPLEGKRLGEGEAFQSVTPSPRPSPSRERRFPDENDLEAGIDLDALAANAEAVLFELEEAGSWQSNPLIYLKIAMIGLDQAVHKPAAAEEERIQRSLSRISGIPRLMEQAAANLKEAPAIFLDSARAMVQDSCRYLTELSTQLDTHVWAGFTSRIPQAARALSTLADALRSVPPMDFDPASRDTLEHRLRKRFHCRRPPDEVYDIGRREGMQARETLDQLAGRIDPNQTWQALYEDFQPVAPAGIDTFQLYDGEIRALKAFFNQLGFPGMAALTPLKVCQTPTYLRSVRSSASFSAACRGRNGEQDLFYITTRADEPRSRPAMGRLIKRLHREHRFLTAHETIPGHHLLDSVRRSRTNPVRRQIESPLFYEGWAYYAESLLFEYGYVQKPIEQLVDAKRRLWRAARCQIDVGINSGRLSRQEAIALLVQSGFEANEAARQVDRFRLNPGYQTCYSLGRYEISELRKKFEPLLGRERFHEELLTGGELPFRLVEQRFENDRGRGSGVGDQV